ncbi:MAG: stage II sporulation protein P [Bacilli bacterium]|nr:stage II sporulation protein P [Bacilli bacterium]
MSSKFKRKKLKIRYKFIFIFITISIGISISYKHLEESKINITDKDLIDLIINNSFKNNNYLLRKILDETINRTNPINNLNKTYTTYLVDNEKTVSKEEKDPIIYLYNTHQSEEYASSNYAEFSVNPTVIMNNYILEDIFNKQGYQTIVEEESISEIIKQNNWKYHNSYNASRILLDKSINNYPSLKYFIDIHRDSLSKDKTTVTIEGKDYAKVLFIVGLENKDYQKNLEFTEKIDNKIKEYYPGLSKGIYKKSGPGVNGVYNQDFNEHTILIEVGGYDNTTTEVLNTDLAFARCFLEVINE